MVPRYARPAMTALWEPEAKYRIWFEIEAHATSKLADLGVVPQSAAEALWDWWKTEPAIDVAAIDAIEADGLDPCETAPDHWRHIGSHIAAGLPFRPYGPERHRAWLRRKAIAP